MASGTKHNLLGIWGSSDTDVFAVGGSIWYSGTIVHYDGNNWSPMSIGDYKQLNGVWGSSGTNVYSVGYNGTILIYDGVKWKSIISGVSSTLNDIWGSSENNIYIVGNGGTILHFNGSQWDINSNSTFFRDLICIWGSSAHNIFAANNYGQIYYYNGQTWCKHADTGLSAPIRGIWGFSENDVFAVGFNGAVFHFDGNTWMQMPSGTSDYLLDVWGASSKDVYAVGNSGTIIHYDGNAWKLAKMTSYQLTKLWGKEGDTFAIGNNGIILLNSNKPVLQVLPTFRNVSASEGSVVFMIENTGTGTMNWTASTDADWISITPKSGIDNASLVVEYDANSMSERSGIITITASGIDNICSVEIRQASGYVAAPSCSIIPEYQEVRIQADFNTQIQVSDIVGLAGFDFKILFDPSRICAKKIEQGAFLGSTGRNLFPIIKTIDCNTGIIHYAVSTLGTTPTPPEGKGVIATINWQTLDNPGFSDIALEDVQLIKTDGTLINHTDRSGKVSIVDCYIHDLDCDSDVDTSDITKIGYTYGCQADDACYSHLHDFDHDGDIDIIDVTAVAYDYGWPFKLRSGSISTRNADTISEIRIESESFGVVIDRDFITDIKAYGIENLGSFEFTLNFDPLLISVQDISIGSFLGSTGRELFLLKKEFDNSSGEIKFAITTLGPSPAGADGDGILATIIWHSKATGQSDINIGNIQLTHPAPISIEAKAVPLQFTISEKQKGDMNYNAHIDIGDAIKAMRIIAGIYESDIEIDLDIDGDKRIGIKDIIWILRTVSEMK